MHSNWPRALTSPKALEMWMEEHGLFVVVRCVVLLTAGFAVKLSHYFVVGDGFEKASSLAFKDSWRMLFLIILSIISSFSLSYVLVISYGLLEQFSYWDDWNRVFFP